MVHRIIEFFLSIPAPLAILVVFLLTAGETARSNPSDGPGLFGASMKVRQES
jgi:hypothetical protein